MLLKPESKVHKGQEVKTMEATTPVEEFSKIFAGEAYDRDKSAEFMEK